MCTLSTRLKNKRFWVLLVSWAAAAACAAVIFSLSGATAELSSARSSGVLALLLERFGLELSSHFVRKTAHALEYCGLALLLSNAYFQTFCAQKPLLAFLSAALYACTDEIHQYFVAGRACLLRDVAVDALGAAAGVLCAAVLIFVCRQIRIRYMEKRG